MNRLRKLRTPFVILSLGLGLGLIAMTEWACSSYGPSPAGVGTNASADANPADEPPSLFNEAPVPEGWPALTPVDEIRIKQYPAYRAAVIVGGESGNDMFRPLFKHIKRQEIAMTAPVEMTYNEQGKQDSMAFLYRNAEMGSLGSDADDPRISVKNIPAQTTLSIGLRGRYSHDRFEEAVEALNVWLIENPGYRTAGEPRYLGYNSPFVPPFMRYGEVQVPVESID